MAFASVLSVAAPLTTAFRRLLRRPASLVGVDIGSATAKVVELTQHASGGVVARVGVRPLPPDSVVKGAIRDRPAVADTVRGLLDAAGVRGRDVALSLPGSAVFAREITLPPMTADELAGSIAWEAGQHIPFDLRDVNLDYHVVRPPAAGARDAHMIVLLAASKKSTIAEYAGTVAEAGCAPVVVDVAAFALQNAWERHGGADAGDPAALVNAGASTINVNIVAGGRSVYTRDIASGGNACTEALCSAHELTFEEAETLKKGADLFGDGEPAVREAADNLLLELEKTFDFFAAGRDSGQLGRIVLSGGASRARGFAAALAQRFDAPVERFDPFESMTIGGVSPADQDPADVAATAGVAAGLALRRAGDR